MTNHPAAAGRRFLVALAPGAAGDRTLDAALQAAPPGATLCLLHVVEPALHATGFESAAVYVNEVLPALHRQGRALLERAAERVRRAGLACETRLHDDMRVADAVLAEARACHADWIVMGTHGRRGLARLVCGSDAEGVLRRADVPVLAVRQVGDVLPA